MLGTRVPEPIHTNEPIDTKEPIDTEQAAPRLNAAPLLTRHLPELDGLRGIAILAVLFTHFFSYSMMGHPWTGLGKLVYQVTLGGWLGVDLFFVLSGFLITTILLASRARPHFFRNFYARRALRILPLYALILAMLWICYAHSGALVLLGLLMSVNFAPLFHIPVVSGGQALWSLAVEEHFYLIWPGVVRMARPAIVVLISGLICVGEPVVRAAARFMVEDVYFYSWFRFDGLAWGALVAVAVQAGRMERRTALRLAAAGVVGALLMMAAGAPYGILHRGGRLGAALQFSLFYILFAACVLVAVTLSGSKATALLRIGPLRLFGDLSYCMYLIHMAVLDLLDLILSRFLDLPSSMAQLSFISLRAAMALATCLFLAALSQRFIERPILSLKRYFPQSG